MDCPTLDSPSTSGYEHLILPLRQRVDVWNGWLRERFDLLLPELMARSGIDMWILIARELNEDPVVMTMLPEPKMAARRRTILVMSLRPDRTVQRLSLTRYGIGDLFQGVWIPEEEDQWECLSRLVRERNPGAIGLNISETFPLADGLSHNEYQNLLGALGDFSSRVVPAETLAVSWLEKRSPGELAAYPAIVTMTHVLIQEAFSNRVIHPGVTTADDVVWWFRHRMQELGVEAWFQPTVTIQSRDQTGIEPINPSAIRRKLILPGDLLHCDVGLSYLGLATDVQHNAYVLRPGEDGPPKGLAFALSQANRVQDIITGEFTAGRTGNELLPRIRGKCEEQGIDATIYTHPVGCHGHGAGTGIGMWDRQQGVPGLGDYPLADEACYAVEFNVKVPVPEWDGQIVTFGLEEDVIFSGGRCCWPAGRQTQLYLIR